MEANVTIVKEGFWSRCWRQASETVYGIRASALQAMQHAKKHVKQGWSWMTSTTRRLAHRAQAGWAGLKLKAATMLQDFTVFTVDAKEYVSAVFTTVKAFLAWESLRVTALAYKVYNWAKLGLTQAAEEAVTVIIKIAMYSAIWLKVAVARIRTAIEVVWNYKKIAAVGAIAWVLSSFGIPFAGTVASVIIIGLVVLVDATVLAHSLQAEYVHYYPQVVAAA